ncbi:MAG: hypothetical protein AB1430_16990 [Pseudomonadota bacterium]
MTPAMRLKAHWFKDPGAKSPAEHASAAAFIAWRVARQMLDRMRKAGYSIDAGPAYFGFLREALVFLVAVADRIAHARMEGPARAEFTTALVLHAADTLAGNEIDLLGPPPPGAPSYRDRFIDLVNELAGHYAEFGTEPGADGFVPDFAFRRYLGVRIALWLPEQDRRWALDQVMDIEAPEAAQTLQRGLHSLMSTEPRTARRAAVSGD